MTDLFERVLARLGFTQRPEISKAGLDALYAAWCRSVPFDNVRKVIHFRAANPAPFPGHTAVDFYEAWLKHGTGGTCWAGNGAFHALLEWLGFDAVRGVATMMAAPNIPPNHGTVQVQFGDQRYLVDCSILHVEPLLLVADREVRIEHPAWGARCAQHEGRWHIHWRPMHKLDGFECRLEIFGAPAQEFADRYEMTRAWSPFNHAVVARKNRGDEVVGMAYGQHVTIHEDGSTTQCPMSHQERNRSLIEDIGLSEEIVSQLPPDEETPPPPGSQTAQRLAEKDAVAAEPNSPSPASVSGRIEEAPVL